MTTLAFLQNQWFKDPDKARALYARHPQHRERFTRSFLFAGSLTGRRLAQAFGSNACREIIWEEISPEIGGHSGSSFPADQAHIAAAMKKYDPNIVMTFGALARPALCVWREEQIRIIPPQPIPIFIHGPHPAARYPEVADQLSEMNEELIYTRHSIFGIATDRRYDYAY